MRRISIIAAAVVGVAGYGGVVSAGPYAPAAGVSGSTAIANTSPDIAGWATGFQDYAFGPNVDLQWRDASRALGPAEGDFFNIVGLGDGGSITLLFDQPIADGAGADFAVFENAFNDTFLELAFVEVSDDDGQTFHRFASDSLTASPVPFTGGAIDPTNIDGLAGKYRAGFGTPFDLAGVGLSRATQVRLVDVVGDGTALDASGGVIYDPHPTVGSAGFDLDGVGVIHQAPEPASAAAAIGAVGAALLLRRSRRRACSRTRSRLSWHGQPARASAAIAARAWAGSPCHTRRRRVLEPVRTGVLLAAATVAMLGANASADTVVDFEDQPLAPGSYYNGSDGAGAVVSRGVAFGNVFDATYQSWYGFAASNVSDTTTPGYANQYAAITGAGAGGGGGGNYGVGYDPTGGGFGSPPTVTLASESQLGGLFVTNVTYAYLAVRDGDDGNLTPFVRTFGDDPNIAGNGNEGVEDYFKLTITGRNAANQETGSVEFYLADYRFADNADDYVVDAWQWVDLSPLGPQVKSLEFSMTSTDASFGYVNTPTFFAIDDLTIVPEPASLAGMLAACGAMSMRRRRARQ
jgi:hypothetical protein